MQDDPIEQEQRAALEGMLRRPLSAEENEGFLIVGSRFVDRFGASRIEDLAAIFAVETQAGRRALAASLAQVARQAGPYARFAAEHKVSVIPPVPAYPLFPILGIETLKPAVFRVLDRRNTAMLDAIKSSGSLPLRPRPEGSVLHATPVAHWCAYEAFDTPQETARMLQIKPRWSDCAARATIATSALAGLAFVPYSLDPDDEHTRGLTFHGYFFEGRAQDHAEDGFAVQIGVFGAPPIVKLEEWDTDASVWRQSWPPPRGIRAP